MIWVFDSIILPIDAMFRTRNEPKEASSSSSQFFRVAVSSARTTVTDDSSKSAPNAAAGLIKYRTARPRLGQAHLDRETDRQTGRWHRTYTCSVAYAYPVQCVRGRQIACLVTWLLIQFHHARYRRRAQKPNVMARHSSKSTPSWRTRQCDWAPCRRMYAARQSMTESPGFESATCRSRSLRTDH